MGLTEPDYGIWILSSRLNKDIHLLALAEMCICFNEIGSSFQCITCNDKFAEREELLAHLDHHNNIKPFKCRFCNLGFTFQSSRKRHEIAHSVHKPNTCDKCNKKFSRKSDLASHMKVHAKSASKISCHHCAQMFGSEREATRHNCSARSRAGKEYSCPICQHMLKTKVIIYFFNFLASKTAMF